MKIFRYIGSSQFYWFTPNQEQFIENQWVLVKEGKCFNLYKNRKEQKEILVPPKTMEFIGDDRTL